MHYRLIRALIRYKDVRSSALWFSFSFCMQIRRALSETINKITFISYWHVRLYELSHFQIWALLTCSALVFTQNWIMTLPQKRMGSGILDVRTNIIHVLYPGAILIVGSAPQMLSFPMQNFFPGILRQKNGKSA